VDDAPVLHAGMWGVHEPPAGCCVVCVCVSGRPAVPVQYRFTMNTTLLRERWLPLMELAVNFYMHMEYYNATDGTYNLPTTFSPEYTYCRGNNTVP
jgi:hypothetical protein